MSTKHYVQPRDCIDLFREEYYFLSNFYPAKLLFDGIAYDNAESAYQAQKLANIDERYQFEHLYADEAKRLGEKIEVRNDWDEVKLNLMAQILYAKFTQNLRLAEQLVKTGELPLLEGNTWGDVYWGVDLKSYKGENHLGKLLMELREDFQKNGIPKCENYRPIRWYDSVGGIKVTDEHIVDLKIDCIVNPAENSLLCNEGLSGTIHQMAGRELLEECSTLGGCGIGKAIITKGYCLKANRIIHTVCPVYIRDDESLLADCYWNCLDLARENGVHSIAFPILAIDKCCFPKQKATRMAVETIRKWRLENTTYKMKVVLSCTDYRIYDMSCEELNKRV